MANTVVYLKAEQNAEVMEPQVSVKDIASVYCADKNISAKVKAVRVHHFHEKEQKRQVVSILKVIELMEKECEGITVISVGENATLIELVDVNRHKGPVQMLKMVLWRRSASLEPGLRLWHFIMTLALIRFLPKCMNW